MYTFSLLSLFITSAQILSAQDIVFNDSDETTKLQEVLKEIRGTQQYEDKVEKIISQSIANFSLGINGFLQQSSETDYNVFSPVSISASLALVLLGSSGKTYEEIIRTWGVVTGLDVKESTIHVHQQFGRMIQKLKDTAAINADLQINFATAIFLQNNYPIRSEYSKIVRNLYGSDILNVPFESNPQQAQRTINDWVARATMGKISTILDESPSRDHRVIITSAFYFKALWEKPFFEEATITYPFYVNGRDTKTNIVADLMANGGVFPYFKDNELKCEVMGFPYKGNASTMYVVKPFDSNAEKLKRLEEKLTPSTLERLANSTRYTDAVMLFPRMKLQMNIDLKPILQRLGIKTLFEPWDANLSGLTPGKVGERAGLNFLGSNSNDDIHVFSRMSYQLSSEEILKQLKKLVDFQSSNTQINPGLHADKVMHKVVMDITETGTEAAAITSVVLAKSGGAVRFRVDVPFFLFIMHEETKTILFWASVAAPCPRYDAVTKESIPC